MTIISDGIPPIFLNVGRDVFIFQPLGQSPRQEWMPRPDLTQEPET